MGLPRDPKGPGGPPDNLRELAEDPALSPQRRAIAVHRLLELREERPLAIGVRVIEAIAVRYGTRQALAAALLSDRHHRRAALSWAVPLRMADGPGDDLLSRALADLGSTDALAASMVDEYLAMVEADDNPAIELLSAWGRHLVTIVEQTDLAVFRLFLRAAMRANAKRMAFIRQAILSADDTSDRRSFVDTLLTSFEDLFPDVDFEAKNEPAPTPAGMALSAEEFDAVLPPESFGNLQAVAEALDELGDSGGTDNFSVFGWEARPGRYVQVFRSREGDLLRAETPSDEGLDNVQAARLEALGWQSQLGQVYVRRWNLSADHDRDLVAAHILQTLRVFGMASDENLTIDINLQ